MHRILFILFLIGGVYNSSAQSKHDHADAPQILNPQGDLNVWNLSTDKIILSNASTEKAEYIPFQFQIKGLDKGSAWFRFHIGSVRDVSIEMRQKDTVVPLNAAGMQIYNVTDPGVPDFRKLEGSLAALSHFGKVRNTCLAPGTYMVQLLGSQKASDSVWLDISVALPNAYSYDEMATPSTLKAGNQNFSAECLSLSDKEKLVFPTADSFKAAWFKVTLDPLRLKTTIQFSLQDKSRIYFYKSRPVTGTEIPFAVFSPAYNDNIYYDFKNDPQRPDTFYIAVFAASGYKGSFSFNIIESKKKVPDYAMPVSGKFYQFGTLTFVQKAYTETIEEDNAYTNPCETDGFFAGTLCDVRYNFDESKYDTICTADTFQYNSWSSFTITAKGRVRCIVSSGYTTLDVSEVYIRIYKDVTDGCGLSEVYNNNYNQIDACLDSGRYFIQLAFKKPSSEFPEPYKLTGYGDLIRLEINYNVPNAKNPVNFTSPATAEQITIPYKNGTVDGAIASFDVDQDTTYILDSLEMKGRFQFREFYVVSSLSVNISVYHGASMALFMGRASEDLSALKRVKGIYYNYGGLPYVKRSFLGNINHCHVLSPGWYTLVVHSDKKYTGSTFCDKSQFYDEARPVFSTRTHTEPKFHRYNKPCMVNGGDALSPGPLIGFGGEGTRQKQYWIEADVFPCQHDPVSYGISSYFQLEQYRFLYYRFTLLDSAEIKISRSPYNSSGFLLYKGLLDATNFKQYDKWTGPCHNDREFCILPPGTYTLVHYGYPEEFSDFRIYYDQVRNKYYDHQRSAMNLGEISTDTSIVSDPLSINCTTESEYTEPFYMQGAAIYGGGVCTETPYRSADLRRIKNNWQTFVVDYSGTIEFRTGMITTDQSIRIYLIESDDDPDLAPDLKSLNYGVNARILVHGVNKVVFKRDFCDRKRYYVITYHENNTSFGNPVYLTFLSFSRDSGTSLTGCDKPNYKQISTTGEYQIIAPYLCSPVYKKQKTGDEFLDSTKKYRLIWFMMEMKSGSPLDVNFSLKGFNLSSCAFRLLMGECDALTTMASASSGTSSFRINCLGNGKYYMQVFVPYTGTGEITLVMKATPTQHGVCKPLITTQPFAQFLYEGACGSDTIRFKNYSTIGSGIESKWYFDGVLLSNLRDPVLPFKTTKDQDSVLVKLVIIHKSSGLSDSITKVVYKYPDKFSLTLNAPEKVWCGQAFKVGMNLSFPYPHYLVTTPPEMNFDTSADYQTYMLEADRFFKVRLVSGTCILEAEAKVRSTQPGSWMRDTVICGGYYYRIEIPDSLQHLTHTLNPAGRNLSKIDSLSPGKYFLTSYSSQSCIYYDTFTVGQITYYSGLPADIAICHGEQFEVDLSWHKAIWSDGSNGLNRTFDKPGVYVVNTDSGACSFTDSVRLTVGKIMDELRDTFFCPGQEIEILSYLKTPVWYPGNLQADKFKLPHAGIYYLEGFDELSCFQSDTFKASELCEPYVFVPNAFTPNKSFLNDSFAVSTFAVKDLKIHIYNRWGEKVFESEGTAWDGTFNGMPCPEGVYYYYLTYRSSTIGKPYSRRGDLTLIR